MKWWKDESKEEVRIIMKISRRAVKNEELLRALLEGRAKKIVTPIKKNNKDIMNLIGKLSSYYEK